MVLMLLRRLRSGRNIVSSECSYILQHRITLTLSCQNWKPFFKFTNIVNSLSESTDAHSHLLLHATLIDLDLAQIVTLPSLWTSCIKLA